MSTTPQGSLEICQRIKALDDERWELNQQLLRETGQSFEEVMAGMTRLLSPVDVDPAVVEAKAQRWLDSAR
jgi:hypothetical protein